jgi:hypothetical protein
MRTAIQFSKIIWVIGTIPEIALRLRAMKKTYDRKFVVPAMIYTNFIEQSPS